METHSGEPTANEELLDELLGAFLLAYDAGENPDRKALLDSHPELAEQLSSFFRLQDKLHGVTGSARPARPAFPAWAPGFNVIFPGDSQNGASSNTVALASASIGDFTEPYLRAVSASTESSTSTPAPATTVPFGDFTLMELIGRGGMGLVYKARQSSLNRIVALKMIVAGPVASAEDVALLRKEAEAAAHLAHPNIVPIHEVGEHRGYHYFAMQFIEGGDLARQLDTYHANRRSAMELLATVSRAVHYAHQQGVLHRDLKPSNILIDCDGRPLVTDFGLSSRLEIDADGSSLSIEPVGTPAYMAPEQFSGHRDALTPAADVYAIGAVMYALLAGRAPFRGDSVRQIALEVKHKLPDPPTAAFRGASLDLDTICLKCLQKDPQKRYASTLEIAEELERWLACKPILSRPVGPAAKLWRWCGRNPLAARLAATAALLVVIGLAGFAYCMQVIRRANVSTDAAVHRVEALSLQTRAMVDSVYSKFVEDWVATQPRMQKTQRDLLT
ncbi:MAG TPA: serine/threonine-protein kinase, partial [Isosphaeraceae bacterium]|nr:serine/threonine-protein kinase [Isosphaeraceae bacterium]